MRNLSNVGIAAWPAILAAFVAQGIARGRIVGNSASSWGLIVWATSSLILVLILVSWSLGRSSSAVRRGGTLIAIGTGANLLVTLVNGGMPVLASVSGVAERVGTSAGFYALGNTGTAMLWLGDVMRLPLLGTSLVSVGDVLLAVGVVVVVIEGSTSTDRAHVTPLTP